MIGEAWVLPRPDLIRGGLLAPRLFCAHLIMAERVCIFVDGENLRHAIASLFEQYDRREYLPKKAARADLFDRLTSQITKETGQRVRTYWYVTEHIDFWPYRFPRPDEEETLRRLLQSDAATKREIEQLEGVELTRKMAQIVQDLQDERSKMQGRFEGWTALQNAIALKHPAIEFRRAGAISYNLFQRSLGKEKAVDVKLATDMIMLRDIYDTAIIVSGDQDYVPAVQVVKDSGKTVVNVAFERRDGRLLPGGARRLNVITDWFHIVKHGDLRDYLFPSP